MGLDYRNLDAHTRAIMADEVQRDIAAGTIYESPRLNEQGVRQWPTLLLEAVGEGTDDSLAGELTRLDLLNATEQSHRGGKPYTKAVPVTAAATLAEGEFNRMYLRAIARRGIDEGRDIVAYRGRESQSPRQASLDLEGTVLPAHPLLASLRESIGVDAALGLPPGPNSGMTGQLS